MRNVDTLEKYGMRSITWKNLCLSEKIAEIEEFLWKADIGSELCGESMSDNIYELKTTLSYCLRKFIRYPGIQCRCIQLLQDCHVLCPVGIVHTENEEIFEAVCTTLDYYSKSSADVITYVFELLAMLCDDSYVKKNSQDEDARISEFKKTGEKAVLSHIITAINTHANVKAVQRGGMLLIAAIFHLIVVESPPSTIYKVFKCVLETLRRNIDDSSICFSSFSILSQVATKQSNLMSSWLDQVIFLAVRTISKQFSAEVVDKCVNLLNSLAKDDTVLVKVAVALHQLTSLQAPSVAVKPGFVIRTKRLLPPQWKKEKNIEKVYINVFHHESIDMVYKTDASQIEIDDTDEEDFGDLVVVTCGEAALTEDADGSQCVLYNLAVSSKYFTPSSTSNQSISSGNAIRQLIRELNMKFGDYLDEANYSLPRISSKYKGGRIPHLFLRPEGINNAALSNHSSALSIPYTRAKELTVSERGIEKSGGLLVLCTAIGLMGSSSASSKQHLDSIIMCLELTFRILVDEHCSAVIFQDFSQQAHKGTSNGPSVFQQVVSAISRHILRLSEEASDDLEITKMDYLNLLFNSIVENLEFLESGDNDFSDILASYSAVSVASSPVGKRTSSHSLYRSFRQSQSLPVLTYSAALQSDDGQDSFINILDADDDMDDDMDENERELCAKRLQWGPLLITTGPQLCDKVSFLNSLQEDIHCVSIDETPGLYEPVYISVALELWKKEAAMDKGKLAELNHVVSFLKRRVVCGLSVFERLMRLRLKEVMFLTLLFHRMISPEEFEEAMAKLIPEEVTRTILLDSVAEIYMSFEDEEEHEESPGRGCGAPMMTSSTLDVFIPEAAVHATASAAQDMKAAIKNTSSLICWANTNIIPDFYNHVLGYAERYNRVVRFVRWGSEIPRISAQELMKRNILRFLSTGRYIEATKLMVFHQTAETLFYANNSAIPSVDMRVTVTHPELASRAGFFMDHIGQVTSVSHPNIQQIMKAAATPLMGSKKNRSRWSTWNNNGLVSPIICENPTSPSISTSPADDTKTAGKKNNIKAKNFKVTFSFPLSTIEEGIEYEEVTAKIEDSNSGVNMAGRAMKTLAKHADACRDEVFEEEDIFPVSENGVTFVLADSGGSLVRHTEIPLSTCASSSNESNPAIDVFYYLPAELPTDGPQSVYSQMTKNPLSSRSFTGEAAAAAEMKEPDEEQWPEDEEEIEEAVKESDEEQWRAEESDGERWPDEDGRREDKIKESDGEQWQEEKEEREESDSSVPVPDDDESISSTTKPDSIDLTESIIDERKSGASSLTDIDTAPNITSNIITESNGIIFCREKRNSSVSSNRGSSKPLQKQLTPIPDYSQGGDVIRRRIKALGMPGANGDVSPLLSSAGRTAKSAPSSAVKDRCIRGIFPPRGSANVSSAKEIKLYNSPVNYSPTVNENRRSKSPIKGIQICKSSSPKQSPQSSSPISGSGHVNKQCHAPVNGGFNFHSVNTTKANFDQQSRSSPRIRDRRESFEVEVDEVETELYPRKACCSYSLAIAGVLEAVGIGAESVLAYPFAQMCSCPKKGDDKPPPVHLIEVINDEGLTLLRNLGKKIYSTFVFILEDSKAHSSRGYLSSPISSPVGSSPSFFASNSTSTDSTVAIRLLRSTIQKMGLIDETNLKTRDLDLIFASYGTQRVSVFEIAHCILLAGRRRFFPLNYNSPKQILVPLLQQMNERMDDLMVKMNAEKEELDAATSNPLLPGRLMTESTALEVKKLFETERKSLLCIYQGYSVSYRELTTKWECSNKEGQSDAANYLRSTVRRKLHSLSLGVPTTGPGATASCSSGNCYTPNALCGSCGSSTECGWSFPTLLQFAKDFMICPDLVSRPQLAKLFNIVLADTSSSTDIGDASVPLHLATQMLSFNQFLNLLVQIALRTPIFKSSQSTVKRVVSLLLLLNQSTGKPKILERLNVTSLFLCKGQPPGRQAMLAKKLTTMM